HPFDLVPSEGAEGVRSGSGAARPTGIVPPSRPPRPPPRAPAAPGRSPADSGQGGRARPGTVPPSSPLRAGRKALLRGRGARPAPAPREPGWHILPLVAGAPPTPSPTVPGVPVHPLMPADPEAIGPYRLLARLGEGGMGRVYLGISRSGRLLAVKAVRSDLAADPDFRTRFAREVDAARLVSGVFSAPLVDADPRAETPWMATGFVAGGSLREVVERAGPLPAEAAAVLAVGLAEALRAVHSAGLVHRDLKPGNVLLAAD